MKVDSFRQQDFSDTSDFYGYVPVVTQFLLIAGCFLLASYSYYALPLVIPLLGLIQLILMDNIGHYASHYTLFKTKWLNKACQIFYFYPVFTTFKEWSDEHKLHHKFLGSEQDPENDKYIRWGLYKNSVGVCFLKAPVSDFRINLSYLRVWRDSGLCMFWLCVSAFVVAFSLWLPFLIWLVSFFVSRPYFVFASEISEHWKVSVNHPHGKRGSRTMIGLIFSVCKPYADRLHWMHHQFPRIPWQNIGKAYKQYMQFNNEPKTHTLRDVVNEM